LLQFIFKICCNVSCRRHILSLYFHASAVHATDRPDSRQVCRPGSERHTAPIPSASPTSRFRSFSVLDPFQGF
jgi:hypothetical protein